MSDEEKSTKHYESSPEKTLITLEPLSQTIEVMTSVVNRLRQHLSEQLENQLGVQNETKQNPVEEKINTNTSFFTFFRVFSRDRFRIKSSFISFRRFNGS